MAAYIQIGYSVADIAALKAIPPADRPAFAGALVSVVSTNQWFEFDPSGTTGGVTPDTGSGRWYAMSREVLNANRTYFVRTDGNDNNTGLANTAGGAFLTIQKAIDTVASLDISIFDVTIQVGDGTYNQQIILKSIVGSGNVVLSGNLTTPANAIITSNATITITNSSDTQWTIQGFTVACTSGVFKICLLATNLGKIIFNKLRFIENSGGYHLFATGGGKIECFSGSYEFSGSCLYHMIAENGSIIDIRNTAITATGLPSFANFVFAQGNSPVTLLSNNYLGSALGSQYQIRINASLYINGATLHGNSAGTVATGGQVF